MVFHNWLKAFGPQPIREQGEWPEFPNPAIWPKALLGKSLEWLYVEQGGTGHVWIVREIGGAGFRFRIWGDRVFGEVGTSPEAMGEDALASVLRAAIGRAFIGPSSPEADQELEIGLWRADFVQAGLVPP